ncbi:MAG: tetratricopeptide repeat protein [Acidobacteria bacterium]|nr:tetratricopeptide repeat protein [Acidobacteriota bacterium]
MMWLKNLIGALGFRTAALRALADSQAVPAGIVCYIVGYLAYALARSFVYASSPEIMYGRRGILPTVLGINLSQELMFLLFLLFLFVPAIVALSNAFSDDGLGLSFSVTEYRAHIAVLFPTWGAVCLVTAPLQWLFPHFLIVGEIIEIPAISLLRALLLGIYTFRAVMRLNYLSPTRTCGVFALSALTVPIFFVVSLFIWSLPFLFLIPLIYLATGWIRNTGVGRTGVVDFQRNMQALTVNPQNADAHYQLGRISLDRGNPVAAGGYFEAAVKITQQVAEYYYYFGLACERKKDWGKALECYEKAYQLDPEYGQGDIFREVGKAYVNTGSVEKGKEFLTFFLSRRDADPEGRYWLAAALQKSGNPEGARFQLTLIIEQAKANPRFFRKRNREWIYRARNLMREIKLT